MLVIQYAKIKGPSPAKIYPGKNVIILDLDKIKTIPGFYQRLFIICHEVAHLFTADESQADYIAFNFFQRLGYPLRDAIYSLTRNLPPRTARIRAFNVLHRLGYV